MNHFRTDIQGLRGLAVLLVVSAHMGSVLMPGGFIGVDMFFVISGFLITSQLRSELQRTQGLDLAAFYARRLRRLLPSLLFVVLVVSAVSLPFIGTTHYLRTMTSGMAAVVWVSNILFASQELDYFAETDVSDLYLHTWSLGVEEQFYLVWPFILMLATGRAGSSPIRGARTLVAVGLASFALSVFWTESSPNLAYYLMPSRIWQFAVGAIVCMAADRQRLGRIGSELQAGFGLILIAASVTTIGPSTPYPGLAATLPTVGTALLLLAGAQRPGFINARVAGNPILTWLGDRSYVIYLWHWPILVMGDQLGFAKDASTTTAIAGIILLLAVVTHRTIELPFWKGRYRVAQPRRILLISCLAIAAAALVQFELEQSFGHSASAQSAYSELSIRRDGPAFYAHDCDDWTRSDVPNPCMFGNRDASDTVVLLGDSIGLQWFSAITSLFDPSTTRMVVFNKSSCSFADAPIWYERIKSRYLVCERWREGVFEEILTMRPRIIFAGDETLNFRTTEHGWLSDLELVSAYRRSLLKLSASADRVVVIPGTPRLDADGPACLTRWERLPKLRQQQSSARSYCGSWIGLPKAQQQTNKLIQAVAGIANVTVLDLNDLVCPDGFCSALSANGVVVYRDKSHLTDTYVQSISKEIAHRWSSLLTNPHAR
jgi:peptidoglycan/LPS O-acetylase OafA/YrhL